MFEIKKQIDTLVEWQVKNVQYSNDFQAIWNLISLHKWNSIVKFRHKYENRESFRIIQPIVPHKRKSARNKLRYNNTKSPKNAFNKTIINKITLIPQIHPLNLRPMAINETHTWQHIWLVKFLDKIKHGIIKIFWEMVKT